MKIKPNNQNNRINFPHPEILFEDNHIIAVNKRASDIVQIDKTEDTPLTESLKEYLKTKYQKPGNVYLGVVHRLDRPVSGAVLFAKTSKSLVRLNEMFRSREIKKKYWAIVKNPPPEDEGHLKNFIKKNHIQNKSYVYNKPVNGTLIAELKYKLIAKSDNYYLIEVELLTGRHHQIRAQLSAIKCPIKGDVKYGFDRPNLDVSICLHARELNFIHPVSKEKIVIIAPVPDDPIWKYFEAQINNN